MVDHVGVSMVDLVKKRILQDLISDWGRIIYHMAVAALSASIALSLPFIVSFIAKNILIYWAMIRNEKIFVISVEMALAILLTILFRSMGRNWKDRKLSHMARNAGLIFVTPARGLLSRRRKKKLKEKQGFARDVMVMGSTGFRTFVDANGDLHQVIQNCREAKIMLLNPFSEGASARAESILAPSTTLESFREQIGKSIAFLKGLKAAKKNIKLKLYDDSPLFKLTILDDVIWIQHYHSGLDVQLMPEYVFKHDQNLGSLYNLFYQNFFTKWNHPNVPEYDLESDELVYRNKAGNEVKREKFDGRNAEVPSKAKPDYHSISRNGNPLERNFHLLHRNHKDCFCRLTHGFALI